MSWLIAILLANIFFGISTILDKFLNTKKIKNVYSYAVILNAVYFIFILLTTYFQRNTFRWGPGVWYGALAGVFWFFMWIFFWKAMQKGEATRVSAIFFSQPIYSALIGMFFFHEPLNVLKWVGISIIIIGAIFATLGGKSHTKEVRSAYLFALVAALLSAIGNAISKYAMQEIPSLTVNCVAFYATIPLYLFLLKDKMVYKEVMSAFTNIKLFGQFVVRGLFGYLGIIFIMTALGSGPISLVVAVNGSQPVFVLAFSLILSVFLPNVIHEEFKGKVLFLKLTALVLTVAGIALVSV